LKKEVVFLLQNALHLVIKCKCNKHGWRAFRRYQHWWPWTT